MIKDFIAKSNYSHSDFRGLESVLHNEYEEQLDKAPINGILAPNGTYVACEYGGHSQVIAKMIEDFSSYMEEDDILAQSIKFSYSEGVDRFDVEMDIGCEHFNLAQYAWIMNNKDVLNQVQKDLIKEMIFR